MRGVIARIAVVGLLAAAPIAAGTPAGACYGEPCDAFCDFFNSEPVQRLGDKLGGFTDCGLG